MDILKNEVTSSFAGGRAVADSYVEGFHVNSLGEKIRLTDICDTDLMVLFMFYKQTYRERFLAGELIRRGLLQEVRFGQPQWNNPGLNE